MFEVASSENPLSETNQNLYSAEPCKASQNEYNNKFARAKKLSKNTCKKYSKKWQPGRQNRPESGKPKTDLLENQPLVGFRFIENRLGSVSVSRRALAKCATKWKLERFELLNKGSSLLALPENFLKSSSL
jgi:hypothetical protein